MKGDRAMEENEYVFTFGWGMPNGGHCVRIKGSYDEARSKMIEKYGLRWAFQYPASRWDAWLKDPDRARFMETEIPFEEEQE